MARVRVKIKVIEKNYYAELNSHCPAEQLEGILLESEKNRAIHRALSHVEYEVLKFEVLDDND